MPRKRRNAPLDLRIRALRVPRTMSPDTYLRSLLRGMESGDLPRGLDVELYWRNPETRSGRSKNWQSGAFLDVVADSSEGFSTLLRRVLQRRLHGGIQRVKPVRPKVRRKPQQKTKRKLKPFRKVRRILRPIPVKKTPARPIKKVQARDAKGRFAKAKKGTRTHDKRTTNKRTGRRR